MKRVLIDTNIYIEFLRGDENINNILSSADFIAFSVISIGEILTGFKIWSDEKKYLNELDEFLYSPRLIIYDIDSETSEFYAKIYNELRIAGNPIPTNDMWIAALALQHGIKLLTNDRHFTKVAGLFLI
ncbi:MAG: type II toxin-antitoxin system VapC family toxin [Actinobacteria bacterium]|nr:type II toxin-antitoxin system VapC family toxin [Actinomycetota bacterium]